MSNLDLLTAEQANEISMNVIRIAKHVFNKDRALKLILENIESNALQGFTAIYVPEYKMNTTVIKSLTELGYIIELVEAHDDDGFPYKKYYISWDGPDLFSEEDIEDGFN